MPLDPSSPYQAVPPAGLWREAMSGRPASTIDPHVGKAAPIQAGARIVTAGSCFAQRLSEALEAQGRPCLVTEPAPPFVSAEEARRLGYGIYSARYGNIYTALQLLQLIQRAFGRFVPEEPLWPHPGGGVVDPFRPGVEPGGFANEAACLWDREAHLAAVREALEIADVLVFTLGLTEAWVSRVDGAVFPVCPGSGLGGRFDPERHVFRNFRSEEVVEHLEAALSLLAEINPRVRVILTVSPVPLMATFEPRHVLQSTIVSKAALRVACDEVQRRRPEVEYFGSYEIVTATGDSAAAFEPDRRSVSAAAVSQVLDSFSRWYLGGAEPALDPQRQQAPTAALARAPMCDEDEVLRAMAS